jgi:hypothetical protein
MKTFDSLAQVNYREGDRDNERYCGGCVYADHGGNALTCRKVPGARIHANNVCDEFRKPQTKDAEDDG